MPSDQLGKNATAQVPQPRNRPLKLSFANQLGSAKLRCPDFDAYRATNTVTPLEQACVGKYSVRIITENGILLVTRQNRPTHAVT